jgi:hypothetical protein
VRATSVSCPATAISQIKYDGKTYRRVALTLPQQAPLATVQVWVQDQPCYDTPFSAPTPPPPLPPPRAVNFPLARLVGITPQVAVGAADNSGSLWVRSSCRNRAAMDVAVACLGLDNARAYEAAKASGGTPFVTTSRGNFPLVVRTRTTCPVASASPEPICRTEAGVVKRTPSVSVRRGDKLHFEPEDTLSFITISYGRKPPDEYMSETWRGWKVTASGRYTLRIVVRGENPAYRHTTTYMLPLHVAR